MMVPVIFAVLFAVIEYAYYFGAVHYVNYATFAAARAQQTSAGGGDVTGNVDEVKRLLLHGNVTKQATFTPEGNADPRSADGSVDSTLPWTPDTPFFKDVMGDMTVSMTMVLGSPECGYEDVAEETKGLTALYQDNRRVCQ